MGFKNTIKEVSVNMVSKLGNTQRYQQLRSQLNSQASIEDFKHHFYSSIEKEKAATNVSARDDRYINKAKIPTPFQRYVFSNYKNQLDLSTIQLTSIGSTSYKPSVYK
jgi:hypothetical protein